MGTVQTKIAGISDDTVRSLDDQATGSIHIVVHRYESRPNGADVEDLAWSQRGNGTAKGIQNGVGIAQHLQDPGCRLRGIERYRRVDESDEMGMIEMRMAQHHCLRSFRRR